MINQLNKMSCKNAAGFRGLAVFLLFSVFFITSCKSQSKNDLCTFVLEKQLYSINKNDFSYFNYEIPDASFTRYAVSEAQKENCILAWNSTSQELLLIDKDSNVISKKDLPCGTVFLNQNYLLTQSSDFSLNKGFEFSLYKVSSSKNIKLKKIKTVFLDCFVSDIFFTLQGICICGGNQEDTNHNVFYITENGSHKCFSLKKNSDFLRMIKSDSDDVYAFLNGRDKSKTDAVLYKFSLSENSSEKIILNDDKNLPSDFDCFFGYGFSYKNKLILPTSLNEKMFFLEYDYNARKIENVIEDCVGCIKPLTLTEKGFFYLAKDSLNKNSFSGIKCFDGNSVFNVLENK